MAQWADHMKPKIGNAAFIFANEPQASSSPLQAWLLKGKWTTHALALSALFMVIGAVVATQSAGIANNETSAQTAYEATPPANVETVNASGKDGQLVGTLIRNQDSNPGFANNQQKPYTLTPEERERLLQIISN